MRPRPDMLRLRSQRMLAASRATACERQVVLSSLPSASAVSTPQSSARNGGHMSSWTRSPRTRPQVPFLLVPSSSPSNRYFTTERKRWFGYEMLAFVKYTLYFWTAIACFVLGQFVIQQEWMERLHPTPSEWTFMSRFRLRTALSEARLSSDGQGDGSEAEGATASAADDQSMIDAETVVVDHVKIVQVLLDLVKRLEDPTVDGSAGLARVDATAPADGPSVLAREAQAFDIRTQSEPWRRGYYEALLNAALTCEHVDGWVADRTRNMVCPPEVVIGPSNPYPRPLPPGSTGAPREEDCYPCFPAPAELYLKLLHTRGLTPRQQITAALAFANYLEYKNDNDAAAYVYGQAVLVARGHPAVSEGVYGSTFFEAASLTSGNSGEPANATAWVKNWTEAQSRRAAETTAPVSQNLVKTLTAFATFKARSGDLTGALPLFIALLQARRAFPASTQSGPRKLRPSRAKPDGILDQFVALLSPPQYPPPPGDGYSPPPPGARSVCEEAALRLHIGEILYASARKGPASTSSWALFSSGTQQHQAREEGIAWTREAVDLAEEQLHLLLRSNVSKEKETHSQGGFSSALKQLASPISSEGKATCRDCLVTGIDNWAVMVAQLARDEQNAAKAGAAASSAAAAAESSWWPSWLSLWGSSSSSSSSADDSVHASAAAKLGRWTAEQGVIEERRRRARDLLEDATPASEGFMAVLKA